MNCKAGFFAVGLTTVLIAAMGAGCSRTTPTDSSESSSKQSPGTNQVVNTICPMMGMRVDPGNVPVDLIREFKGQKVGFCCASCPGKWDALTNAQKEAKLAAARAKKE